MFKKISDVIVKGGCFAEETQLHNLLQYPVNILYGPNGSGKTTVSRCLAAIASPSDEYSAQLSPLESQHLAHSVFVFNEDFVDKNVKIANGGLEPIIIFGPNIEIQGREDDLRKVMDENSELRQNFLTDQTTVTQEIEKIQEKLERSLKETFSENDKQIKGNQKRSPFKIDDFNDCKSLDPNTDIHILKEQFQRDFTQFNTIRSNGRIEWTRPVIPVTPALIENVNSLLNKVLQQKEISERDEFIFQLANSPHFSHYIEKTQNDIIQPASERCPLCHQTINGNYREELRHRLECVLNEERKNLTDDVGTLKNSLVEISISDSIPTIAGNYPNELATIIANEAQLNGLIKDSRDLLSSKKDVLFNVVQNIDLELFEKKYQEIQVALDTIEKAVAELNAIADNKREKEAKLLKMNKQIAYLDNWAMFHSLEEKKKNLQDLNDQIKLLDDFLQNKNDEMALLRMKKASTKIALDRINQYLAYVFYNQTRLTLEYENEKYVLKSNGKKVAPNKVSTGERNIIALAYFFTSILQGKNSEDTNSDPALIVIDDPITSFDYGNRIGVFTLIKWQLKEIFQKSKNSKALIMSHDQRTVSDLFEIQKQIAYDLSTPENKVDQKPAFYNLRERKMLEDTPQSEYEVELQNIYDFAIAETLDDMSVNVTIGNQMRRVLEHYAKMMSNTDFVNMLYHTFYHIAGVKTGTPLFKSIVSSYQQFLSRMVINTESHAGGNDYECFEQRFNPEELQKYAKYLLCFIYDTNQSHLYAYLKKERVKTVLAIHKNLFGV